MKPPRVPAGEPLLTHRMPPQVFQELCAGTVTSEFVDTVLAAQYSRRKLLLRAVVDICAEQPETAGPLTDAETAWEILATAQENGPDVVRELLTYPTVGVWAARILRRIKGYDTGVLPVWSELGYFHALVASAAVRTGIRCEITVPVVHGTVTLPTVGQVELPTSFPMGFVVLRHAKNVTVLSTGRGDVTVTSFAHDHHVFPVRRHVSVSRGLRWDVEINDSDPYREFSAPVPPRRMDPVRIAEWRKMLDEAFDILTLWHPEYARELVAGLRVITPLTPGGTIKGASSSAAVGGVGVADKGSATELAETLVHEFQHSKLNGLLSLVDIGGHGTTMYAPWRDVPRPTAGLLHGVFAFLSVAELWRVQRDLVGPGERKAAHFTFALRRHQVMEAVRALRDHPDLTAVGRQLVMAVDARLAPLRRQPVAPELAATVQAITDEHRCTWRLWHTRPDPHDIARLTTAWSAGTPPPAVGPSRVVPSTRPMPRSPRRDLLLLSATRQDGLDDVRRSTVSPADSAFLRGDYEPAALAYMAGVHDDPDDVDSWVGFGLALRGSENPVAAGILDAPEVAAALYGRVLGQTGTAPDLPRLAAWLSTLAVTAA